MKTTIYGSLGAALVFLASSSLLPGQKLKQVANPPQAGTFWLLSSQLDGGESPPYPFDPYGGLLPVYQMDGFAGQFVVADSREDYQQLQAERSISMTLHSLETLESFDSTWPDDGGIGGEAVGEFGEFSPTIYTNAPEELLFDTLNSGANGLLPSWRDVRTFPVPDGSAFGILIATNSPFELTRIEAEVEFEIPEALPNTEIEAGFFRNTNQFALGMYADPEYIASDVNGTLSKTLTDLGEGRWLLSLELPTYAWGTNRVVTVRTVPNSEGTMAKLKLVTCSDTVAGVTAYVSDNTTTNLTEVPLPKMRVYRRMLSPIRSPSYEKILAGLELAWLPGYQLGSSTDLALPFEWETDHLRNWRTIVDTREGTGFFLMRPDPTE